MRRFFLCSPCAALALTVLIAVALPSAARQQPALPGVKVVRDVPYIAEGHVRQKLDLYLPDSDAAKTASSTLPLIIWVHGGGWQAGDKSQCPPVRSGFVSKGYAVASIGYRLSGDAPFPAQIDDVKAAVRWLRDHAKDYHLDPVHFGIWGSSAGGHLASLLGTSGGVEQFGKGDEKSKPFASPGVSSRVQAVCDFFGPTDLIQMAKTPGYERHADGESPESKLLGGPVLTATEQATRANPITYVNKEDPPFLIVHGDKDPVVPLDQSRLLFDALKKVSVPVRFHTLRGAQHGGVGFSAPATTQMVLDFFDRHLKTGKDSDTAAVARTSPEATQTESDAPAAPSGSGPLAAGLPAARPGPPPWEAVLRRRDTNQDGKLSREEFPGPKVIFERLDRDKDGQLTREEYAQPTAPGSATRPSP